jgi:hypothetical protein
MPRIVTLVMAVAQPADLTPGAGGRFARLER